MVNASVTTKSGNKYFPKNFRTTVPYGYYKISVVDFEAQATEGGDPDLVGEDNVKLDGGTTGYLLVPDTVEIELLDSALNQLDNGNTVKDVLAWMNTENPNRSISYAGLYKLWGQYRPNHSRRSPIKRGPVPKVLTPEQIKEKKAKLIIANERRNITNAKKRLEKMEVNLGIRQEVSKIAKSNAPVFLDYAPEEHTLESDEVIFKANPGPQSAFFASSELEVLYGGAAGGELKLSPTASFHSNVSK
jgi:hypothetical protein